ncbi:MAG TPA: Fur family transcriptional regulator [Alphaproteobacteria bacterium]|nr:Fur family transcriptional regulator [Alphaproteobacteria bacterium]HAJ47592.1 Fur family transcriptional regulator [Alphaproteobacteria bacterium]
MTGPSTHDHLACVAELEAAADALALERGINLTPLRRQVLSLICKSHKPVGAYQILAEMSQNRAEPVAPPTVYRALDFLVSNMLVHRIDSLNAFVACFRPHQAHHSVFLICDSCQDTRELDDADVHSSLARAASRAEGFQTLRQVVELHGRCQACAAGASVRP